MLIIDKNEINRSLEMLFPYELQAHEGIFVSLSCRNKYVSAEERQRYKLTGTEMFARKVCRKKEDVISWIERFHFTNGGLDGYYSKSGLPLPVNAMTVYINTNPTDGLWVAEETVKYLNNGFCGIIKGDEGQRHKFGKITNVVNTFYQKSRSKRVWVDVDIDFYDTRRFDVLLELTAVLIKRGVDYFIVETRSGFHVLMKADTIKFNYPAVLKILQEKYKDSVKEIEVNKNEMLPLPGTLQAGHSVYIRPCPHNKVPEEPVNRNIYAVNDSVPLYNEGGR